MYDEVKKLRNEVQLLRDELAIMKRKYEDIIYNLDTGNFSSRFVKEQGDMRTAVEVTAEGIKTKVSKEDLDKELEQYSTIEQTAEMIKTKVSKEDLDKELEQYSTTEQTAEKIETVVSEAGKNYATKTEVTQTADSIYMLVASNADLSNAEEIDSLEELENRDTNKVYKYITNANKDDEREVYYQYNHIIEEWQIIDGTIYTVFKQTKDGFHMRGNVVISGDLITGGTISGSNIKGGSFVNSAGTVVLTLGGSVSSDMGDMTLSTDDGRQVFQVYDEGLSTLFKTAETTFLTVSGSSVYPYGAWNFKYADVTGLDSGSGGVAVFG